jgi:RNA polymerase sigma-70 factor (ECF subfamily)
MNTPLRYLYMQRHEILAKTFEEAYTELLEPIFRYFFFRLNDRDRAKELAQETFMRAWLYAKSGKEIKMMKPFLYTTANNLFKNELRGRHRTMSLNLLMEEGGFDRASDDVSPEDSAEARLLMDKVDALPASYREVLMLRYVDGLSLREIGSALGKSEGAAGVQVHRALQKLKVLHEKT